MKSGKRILKIVGFSLSGIIGLLFMIFIVLFVGTQGSYSVPDTIATDPTLPSVTIDGITFHAETFGNPNDQVVVVVHGGPGGDYGYLLNLHELEDDFYVVFYDQRGAGLSPRVSADELTLQSSVDDLHRIVTHYGQGEPVRVIGHSWGAMLAAAYVGQHPHTVAQVVLAEPGAMDNAGLERFNARQADSLRSADYYRLLVPTIFESLRLDGPDSQAQVDYIYGKMSANFVNTAASGYQCADENVTAVGPDVPVPPSRFGTTAYQTLFGIENDLSPIADNASNYQGDVLFIASECNSFIGVDFQREQMRHFPQAELAIIADAGHEMFSENPAASLTAVREFFGQ
ncbi:MAG: alpha/beta hydrolase [Anaerolineaceae bacterium]|nr:alpha/beta hydrolase [Anaerolineaceae bacterium]